MSDINSNLEENLAPPVISEFTMIGVNGYKDIGIWSNTNFKVVSAENGSGKTTLLNTLYALLSGDHALFLAANFETFQLTINGVEIRKRRQEFSPLNPDVYRSVIEGTPWNWTSTDAPTPSEVEEALLLKTDNEKASLAHTAYALRTGDRYGMAAHILTQITESILSRKTRGQAEAARKNFRETHKVITKALNGAEILYLPTYRRIERSMPGLGPQEESPHYFERESTWDDAQLIHFGLNDVSQQLKSRAEKIRSATIREFSRISGQALDDLLEIKSGRPIMPPNLNIERLRILLGRLEGDTDRRIEKIISLIGTGEIYQGSHGYLLQLLGQLMKTYESTQFAEMSLERFASVIGDYWRDDPEKSVIFDRVSAEVSIRNNYTGNTLPLDALSSGEKQVISILARLHLAESSRYIVLIDEPEISLSIEWQRKILMDVCTAPALRQMIAITHSPFIFKNDLRRFAGDMHIERRQRRQGYFYE